MTSSALLGCRWRIMSLRQPSANRLHSKHQASEGDALRIADPVGDIIGPTGRSRRRSFCRRESVGLGAFYCSDDVDHHRGGNCPPDGVSDRRVVVGPFNNLSQLLSWHPFGGDLDLDPRVEWTGGQGAVHP